MYTVKQLESQGKDPFLVLKKLYTEDYLGGSAAIANNLSDFCDSITLCSFIGSDKKYEKFSQKKISQKMLI